MAGQIGTMPSAGLRINIGCGRFPMAGWVNVDIDPAAQADVVHDLERFPYPFESASAAEIMASHVVEHTSDPFATMKELARLLKPGGTLTVRVPHFSRGMTHPDHRRGFDVTFPRYFAPDFTGGYCGVPLERVSVRLRWFAQPYLKRLKLSHAQFHRLGRPARGSISGEPVAGNSASRFWVFLGRRVRGSRVRVPESGAAMSEGVWWARLVAPDHRIWPRSSGGAHARRSGAVAASSESERALKSAYRPPLAHDGRRRSAAAAGIARVLSV
jgi:SAM-dependent methyltransferase